MSTFTDLTEALYKLESLPVLQEPGEEVHELCLCEYLQIIPRPGQLYRYTVDPGCKTCEGLAAEYHNK